MTRNGKFTRRTALGLIGAGGLLTASEAFGFTEISAGRGVRVNASDDPNALLGIEGADDTSITPTFTNQSSNQMDVTLDSSDDVEFDVGDNGNWKAPPLTFSLSIEESQQVNIRFAGECTDAGAATIDVDSDLTDESSTKVGSIALTRDFEIPQSGQIQFDGNVDTAGASGQYSFEIVNTGCDDVTFTGIGINETTTNAEFVSGDGSLYNDDTGEVLVQDEIPIDSSTPDSDTRRDMDPSVTVPVDTAVNFEFDSFHSDTGGNNKVDMRDEDVRVTLYFDDGSSASLKLCLDGCDF